MSPCQQYVNIIITTIIERIICVSKIAADCIHTPNPVWVMALPQPPHWSTLCAPFDAAGILNYSPFSRSPSFSKHRHYTYVIHNTLVYLEEISTLLGVARDDSVDVSLCKTNARCRQPPQHDTFHFLIPMLGIRNTFDHILRPPASHVVLTINLICSPLMLPY